MPVPVQWRRSFGFAATAIVLLSLLACAGGAAGNRRGVAGATPATAGDTAAAVAQATALTKALHSYAFVASQRLSGGVAAQETTLTGRTIRPDSLSYDVNVGGKVQQVIKVAGRTYVREPSAAWVALDKPGSTVDPVASLLQLLGSLEQPALVGHTLSGRVAATVLSKAGLAPAGGVLAATTPVTFTLDTIGRVLSVALQIAVKAGSHNLVLDESTTFTSFDVALPINAPGLVK